MAIRFSVIIPTKDRSQLVRQLLQSMKTLRGLERIRPEIVVGDNGSTDRTWETIQEEARCFSNPVRPLKVNRPGKCAVLNEAIRVAGGEILVFLDDDVVVEAGWLEALERFFQGHNGYSAAQGVIRLSPEDAGDASIRKLLHRYRTIPNLEYKNYNSEISSLNGANMAIRREAFDRVGDFDERLGPGAAGTSEDVEICRRLLHAKMKIGYMREAIVYHRVDPSRLTEAYFKLIHRRQGQSRLLFKNPGLGRILFDLSRASVRYGLYALTGNERNKYRNKGRVFHYLGMLENKFSNGNSGRGSEE